MEPGDYIYTTLAREILLIIAGGSRGEFRAVGPPKTQSGLFAPPQRLIGVSLFTALYFFFYRYEYFQKSLALPDSLFLAFFEVQNFRVFFGIPKSFRNWILTHPGSTKNQVSLIKNAHLSSIPKISTSVIFLDDFWGTGLFVCWGLRVRRRPGQFAPPGRWKVGHFAVYIIFRK